MYNGKTAVSSGIKYAIYKPVIDCVMELKKTHTLKELGVMFGISQGSAQHLTTGEIHHISIERIIKIANILGGEIVISCTCKDKTLVTKLTK